ARNLLYDKGVFSCTKVGVPIVSVGNITVGGTGKTPIVDHLIRWSVEKGLRPAAISRGYKGKFSGVKKVVPHSGLYFGDEPMLLASRNTGVPIYVGADRVSVVQNILQREQVNIVFADDAFQHRRLFRDLDIVVVDMFDEDRDFRTLPLGRGR